MNYCEKKNGANAPFFLIAKSNGSQIANYRRRDLRALSSQPIAPKNARARIAMPQLPTVGMVMVVEVLLVEVLVLVEVDVEVEVDVDVEVEVEVDVDVDVDVVVEVEVVVDAWDTESLSCLAAVAHALPVTQLGSPGAGAARKPATAPAPLSVVPGRSKEELFNTSTTHWLSVRLKPSAGNAPPLGTDVVGPIPPKRYLVPGVVSAAGTPPPPALNRNGRF